MAEKENTDIAITGCVVALAMTLANYIEKKDCLPNQNQQILNSLKPLNDTITGLLTNERCPKEPPGPCVCTIEDLWALLHESLFPSLELCLTDELKEELIAFIEGRGGGACGASIAVPDDGPPATRTVITRKEPDGSIITVVKRESVSFAPDILESPTHFLLENLPDEINFTDAKMLEFLIALLKVTEIESDYDLDCCIKNYINRILSSYYCKCMKVKQLKTKDGDMSDAERFWYDQLQCEHRNLFEKHERMGQIDFKCKLMMNQKDPSLTADIEERAAAFYEHYANYLKCETEIPTRKENDIQINKEIICDDKGNSIVKVTATKVIKSDECSEVVVTSQKSYAMDCPTTVNTEESIVVKIPPGGSLMLNNQEENNCDGEAGEEQPNDYELALHEILTLQEHVVNLNDVFKKMRLQRNGEYCE